MSVRSGGHSMAGFGTNDGGMVIDLSPMKAITIDPAKRTARIEPGLTWIEVAQAAHQHGLALTSAIQDLLVSVACSSVAEWVGWSVNTD